MQILSSQPTRGPILTPPLAAPPQTARNLKTTVKQQKAAAKLERTQALSSLSAKFPAGKPRVLVIGAYGQVGSVIVEQCLAQGFDVSALSRRGEPPELLNELLLQPNGVKHLACDVFAEKDQPRFQKIARDHDLIIMAKEPWCTNDEQITRANNGLKQFYQSLNEAGYTQAQNEKRRGKNRWPKRLLRIGSPPAEIPLSKARSTTGFQENAVTLEQLHEVASKDSSWQNPYFRGKVSFLNLFHQAVKSGLDGVSAAPTALLSWYGDHHNPATGVKEPYAEFANTPALFTPSTLVDAIPGDIMGRGVLLVGLAGKTGESYQLGGGHIESFNIFSEVCRSLGKAVPSKKHFSESELDYQIRLLNGEEQKRIDREVGEGMGDMVAAGTDAMINTALMYNPWTFWIGAWKAGVDTLRYSAKAAKNAARATKNTYDLGYHLTLKAMGMENWQAALIRQMQWRSSNKVRDLNKDLDSRFANLAYPSDQEIITAVPEAVRKMTRWFQLRGLVKGQPININLKKRYAKN